jgi:S-adenosylmethionine-dependent methyltransferase
MRDRSFDGIAERFVKNIYGSGKGEIRLHILWRDMQETMLDHLPQPARVLDAGGGLGQLSQRLANLGHDVTLCDASGDMLVLAREQFLQECPDAHVHFVHAPVQQLAQHVKGQFDVILCHALLEWLAAPRETMQDLLGHLRPGGYLSLAFYNLNSLVYRNLLRGNLRKVANNDFKGDPGSLTPMHALLPEDVMGWVREWNYELLLHSGIRVFSDFVDDHRKPKLNAEEVLEAELRFSRVEPYRSLGRYIHVLARKL